MQILVVYHSRTGNTKKVAEAVADGVKKEGATCVLKPVSEVTNDDFLLSEGIIAGSPVYFGSMASEMKAVFDNLVKVRSKMGDKVGAAFATSADSSGGKETTIFSIIQAMLICGMIVVGDPLDATGHYGVACVGAPDEKTLQHARKLGKRVALLVKRIQ
ncbi:MAG: NAD(P)H-dependent oxidoreductase [Theionarchaea archaeon]|nr:MAG: flavodoxin [Theionarchaea archaeon DG-70]MBU7011175.1 NAD(P)H-dependent oxidoreductase [Theionarchaea archaeon]